MIWSLPLLLLLLATPAWADRIFVYGFEGNHDPTTNIENLILQEFVFSDVSGTPTVVQDTMAGTTDNNFALELNPAANTKEYVEVEVPEGNIYGLHVTMKITDNPRSGFSSRRRIVMEGRRDIQETLLARDDFNIAFDQELSIHSDHGGTDAHFPNTTYWLHLRGYAGSSKDHGPGSAQTLKADGSGDAMECLGAGGGDGALYIANVTPAQADYYIQGVPDLASGDDDPAWLGVRMVDPNNGYLLKVMTDIEAGGLADAILYRLDGNDWTPLSGTDLYNSVTENVSTVKLSIEGSQVWMEVDNVLIGSKYTDTTHTAVGNPAAGLGNLGLITTEDCATTLDWDDILSNSIEPDEPTFLVTYTPIFKNALISPGQFELFWANRNRECFFSKYDGTDCEDDITNCVDAGIFGDQFCDQAIFGKSVVLDLASVNQLLVTMESGVDLDATRPHDVRIGLWVNGRNRGTSIRPQGVCSGLAADESVARACGADADCDQAAPADTCSSTTVNKTGRILIGGTEDTIDGAMTLRIDDVVIADHIDLDMAFLRLQDLKIDGTCDPRDWTERGSMSDTDHGAGLDRLGGNQTLATDGDTTWMESTITAIVDDLCTLSNITVDDGHGCSGSPARCQGGVNDQEKCTVGFAVRDCDEFIDPNAGFALLAVIKNDLTDPPAIKLTLRDGTSGGVDGTILPASVTAAMDQDVWELWYGGTFIQHGGSGAWTEAKANNARIEILSVTSDADMGVSEAYAVMEISMPRPPIIPHLTDQDGDGEICVLIVGDSRLADWAATGALLGEVEQITTLRHLIGPGLREQYVEENFLAMLRGQAFTSQFTSGESARPVTITGSVTAKVDYVIFDVSAHHLLQDVGVGLPKGHRGFCHMPNTTDSGYGANCGGHPDGHPPENVSEVLTNWLTTRYCIRGTEFGQECLTAANPSCAASSGWPLSDPNSCIDGTTDPNSVPLCRPGTLGDRDCIGGVCYQPPSLGWNAAVLNSLLDQAADANSVPIVLANTGAVMFPRKHVGTYQEGQADSTLPSYPHSFFCQIDPNHHLGHYAASQSSMAWNLAGERGVNRINLFKERQRRCGNGFEGCIRDTVHACTSRRFECAEENWPTSPSVTDTLLKYTERGLGNCCRFNPDGPEPLPTEIDLDIIGACLEGDSATGGDGDFVNADCTVKITNP